MVTLKMKMSQKVVRCGETGGKWWAGITWEAITLIRGNPHSSLDEGRAGVVGERWVDSTEYCRHNKQDCISEQ